MAKTATKRPAKAAEPKEITMTSTEVATVKTAPAPMVGASEVRAQDLVRPNLRLLQALSPEVKDQGMKAGTFLIDVIDQELGSEFEFTVLAQKRRFVLWNPQRDAEPKILATSTDCVTWDNDRDGNPTANRKFEVMIKNVGKVTWDTKGSVNESGLHLFGSSVPSVPKSAPAAAETFDFLIYVHGSRTLPCVLSLSRSKHPHGKKLNTILHGGEYDPRSIKVRCVAFEDRSNGNEFWNLKFGINGDVPADQQDRIYALAERFSGFIAQDRDEEAEVGPKAPTVRSADSEY